MIRNQRGSVVFITLTTSFLVGLLTLAAMSWQVNSVQQYTAVHRLEKINHQVQKMGVFLSDRGFCTGLRDTILAAEASETTDTEAAKAVAESISDGACKDWSCLSEHGFSWENQGCTADGVACHLTFIMDEKLDASSSQPVMNLREANYQIEIFQNAGVEECQLSGVAPRTSVIRTRRVWDPNRTLLRDATQNSQTAVRRELDGYFRRR